MGWSVVCDCGISLSYSLFVAVRNPILELTSYSVSVYITGLVTLGNTRIGLQIAQ